MTLKVGKKYWTEGGELYLYIGDCQNGPVFEVLSNESKLELINRNHNLHELKERIVHERWIVWWQHGKEIAANVYATLQTKPMWDNDHPGLICLEIKKIIYEQKFHP